MVYIRDLEGNLKDEKIEKEFGKLKRNKKYNWEGS